MEDKMFAEEVWEEIAVRSADGRQTTDEGEAVAYAKQGTSQ